jgi:hypothetical protein
MPAVEQTRLVLLMNYVERHQQPPNKGVSRAEVIHAGYTREEVDAAVDQGYIDRVPGAPRIEYMVSGYTQGSV